MREKSILLILAFTLFCFPRISSTAEFYFLDNSQVLLYKIINWWYYAPIEESAQLCRENLRYVNKGESKVSYIENGSFMKISFENGFASLLSIVKESEAGSKPYITQSTWLSEEYFPGATATLTIDEFAFTNEYSILIKKVKKETVVKLQGEQKQLLFTLVGNVQGLQNGKVTLNPNSDFLEKCFDEGQINRPKLLAHVVVTNPSNNSPLIKFNISIPVK